MTTKKKTKISDTAKKFILGEVKRFKTVITKYYPDGKDKKVIISKIEEIETVLKEAIG